MVGLAYKSVVSPSASDATLSFEFTYQALKAYLTDGADTFTADGKTYTVDESGSVMDGATEVAYVSPYVVQALMPDVFLSRDFSRISSSTPSTPAAKSSPTPTSPSSWMRSPPPMRRRVPAAPSPPDDSQMPDDTPQSATAGMISPSTLPPTAGPFCRSRPAASTISIPLPAREHLMGTDGYGMDMLTRLMYGGRVSLMIGFIVIIIETVLGVILGGIAGYFGGWVDNLIMRLCRYFLLHPLHAHYHHPGRRHGRSACGWLAANDIPDADPGLPGLGGYRPSGPRTDPLPS